jgi:hypothetical protein
MTQEQSVYPDIALYVSISASQSVSRNSEGHMKSVQAMKCMLFILICNIHVYLES